MVLMSVIFRGGRPRRAFSCACASGPGAASIPAPAPPKVLSMFRRCIFSPFAGTSLKEIFQPELHLAIVVDGGRDSSEGRAAHRCRGSAELRRIGEIKCLPPKLHPMPFFYPEFLEQREIPGLGCRSIEEIYAGGAVSERA